MVRVNWSKAAIDDLEAIRLYIAQFNPTAAAETVSQLFAAGNSLSAFPRRGRPAAAGTRELVPIRTYILRYDVLVDSVSILSVRHAARLADDA